MLGDNSDSIGIYGLCVIALGLLVSGIVSLALCKNKSTEGDVSLCILYGITAFAGFTSLSSFFWALWAWTCSITAVFALYNHVNDASTKKMSEYRAEARAALSGFWLKGVITTFVLYVLFLAASTFVGNIFFHVIGAKHSLILENPKDLFSIGQFGVVLALAPMIYSFNIAFLRLLRKDPQELGYLFQEFNSRVYTTMILSWAYTILWFLLLIIPGIIKGYSYAMTPYILEDRPELSGDKAIEESMRMMSGHKWELFCLHLSFIGWELLCILTLGIGQLWLVPYMQTAQAAFYENLKREDA